MSTGEVGHTRSRVGWIGVAAGLWLCLLLAGSAVAQTPPPPAPTTTEAQRPPQPAAAAAPIPANICRTAEAKSPATDIAISLDPGTAWQPRGGQVRVVVESKVQPLSDIDAVVCFRWARTEKPADWPSPSPVRVAEFSSNTAPAKAVFSATVPNLPRVKSNWFGRLFGTAAEAGDEPDEFDTGKIVPVADMKVVLLKSNAVLTTAVIKVGVTSVWNSVIATFVCIVGAHLVLYAWAVSRKVPGRSPWMRLITTREGFASLSQMQIMLWSFVFGAGAVYVMILSGSLINIPVSALVLLGIAGATTLGARIQGSNAANKALTPATHELPAGTAAPAAPSNVRVLATTDHTATLAWDAPTAAAVHSVTYAQQDFADWRQSNDRIKETSHRVGRLLHDTTYVFQVVARNAAGDSPPVQVTGLTKPAAVIPRQPRWSDLVVTPQHPGEIDVTRVQMLFFTLISAGFVAIKLISGYTIPEIPEGFMLLMGISNGVYLSAKFVPD